MILCVAGGLGRCLHAAGPPKLARTADTADMQALGARAKVLTGSMQKQLLKDNPGSSLLRGRQPARAPPRLSLEDPDDRVRFKGRQFRTYPVTSSWATAVRAIMTAVGFWICISRKRTFPSLVSFMSVGHKKEECELAQMISRSARGA